MFNSGKNVGDLNDNLTLQTKGKVYIQYGQKFVELLNNNGELNVPFLSEIKQLISLMKSSKEGDVLRYNGKNFEQYNVDNKFGEIEKGINSIRRSSAIQYSENQEISTNSSIIQFQNTGGSQEILINNEFNQRLSIKEKSNNWIDAKLSGNTLTVTVGSNPGQKREGCVTIQTESGDTLDIYISQEKVQISGPKGNVLISFDYIGSNNVTNNQLYLTGFQDEKFTVYCKKFDSNGLVPGDTSISKAPRLLWDEYGIFYYNSDINTQGDNYTYEFEINDELQNGKSFSIHSEENDYYNESNTIVAEYSEEHGTVCFVKIGTEDGQEHSSVLHFPNAEWGSTASMEELLDIERDYNPYDGYFTFECIRKVNGELIEVSNLRLTYMHHFGVGGKHQEIRWYSIRTDTINGKYGVYYHIDSNPYPQDRTLKLGLMVNFADNSQYEFAVNVNQYPVVYLTCGGNATAPTNSVCTVNCDGSSVEPRMQHSEELHYYATKYDSPVNSPFKNKQKGNSSTNFVQDSQGTVVLHFDEENSTAQIESITEQNQQGWVWVDLKPNNTNQILKLYPYVDYVDNEGNIITSTKLMDITERDRILQDTCN